MRSCLREKPLLYPSVWRRVFSTEETPNSQSWRNERDYCLHEWCESGIAKRKQCWLTNRALQRGPCINKNVNRKFWGKIECNLHYCTDCVWLKNQCSVCCWRFPWHHVYATSCTCVYIRAHECLHAHACANTFMQVSTEARRERTSDPLELKLVSGLTPSLGTNPGPLECQHRMLTTTQSS